MVAKQSLQTEQVGQSVQPAGGCDEPQAVAHMLTTQYCQAAGEPEQLFQDTIEELIDESLYGPVDCGTGSASCYHTGAEYPPVNVACVGRADQCNGVPCSGSPETIGDFVPGPTASSTGIEITDINSIWIVSGGKNVGGLAVGWLYKTSAGVLFQPNYANATAWSGSIGAGLGKTFNVSVGAASPGGYGSVSLWNGSLPPGSHPVKCESYGADIVG